MQSKTREDPALAWRLSRFLTRASPLFGMTSLVLQNERLAEAEHLTSALHCGMSGRAGEHFAAAFSTHVHSKS